MMLRIEERFKKNMKDQLNLCNYLNTLIVFLFIIFQ